MRPNNRWHYELLMQTVSRFGRRVESGWKKQVTHPCALLPFSPFESGPFFSGQEGGRGSREIRVTRRPLIPLIRPTCNDLSLSFSFFFPSRATFAREQQSRAARWLTRGPVDLFMANWKRKLRATIGSLPFTHQTFFLNGALNATFPLFYRSPFCHPTSGRVNKYFEYGLRWEPKISHCYNDS